MQELTVSSQRLTEIAEDLQEGLSAFQLIEYEEPEPEPQPRLSLRHLVNQRMATAPPAPTGQRPARRPAPAAPAPPKSAAPVPPRKAVPAPGSNGTVPAPGANGKATRKPVSRQATPPPAKPAAEQPEKESSARRVRAKARNK